MTSDMYSMEERCLVDDREAILNKKAVYEPSKTQRFRQIVCSRGIAVCILLGMGATMIAIALIAAFARPASSCVNDYNNGSLSLSQTDSSVSGNDGKTKPTSKFIATNGKPFPWKELLLPKNIIPISYEIFLHPNISESYFTGSVRMTLKVVKSTDFIVFHVQELNISELTVSYYSRGDKTEYENLKKYSCEVLQNRGNSKRIEGPGMSGGSRTPGAKIGIKTQLEYTDHQQYYVQVAEVLGEGSMIDVSVGFRGSLADMEKMSGFYKSSYTVKGEKRYMASTQFESISARNAFPCMDEPALKATFTLSIVRDPNMITLFNTRLLKSDSYKKDLVLDYYEPTVCMSSYLVAYVVTDFKSLTKQTKDGVMVRVFASEDKIYMGQYALDAAVTIIEKYNDFFGIPYPLAKQDLIAIPNFSAGAMENWGLITYRETAVLYDPKKSMVSSKKYVALVVAHELAHQWFGNLVTMKWWSDLWLNEGFATYVENIGAETVDPSFHMIEDHVTSCNDVFKQDSLSSSHPIEVKIVNPTDVDAAFNMITYKKGSSLIRMLQGALGSDDFHQGLNYYLKTHAYSNAETQQLWDAFQKKSDQDVNVSRIMDTWTKQMGYPVVTVTRKNNLITLHQERFLLNSNSSSSDNKKPTHKYSWYIPFKYKLSSDATSTQMVWMKGGDATIQLPASTAVAWIKGNADTEGFYRVNYDKEGWKAITKQLQDDHTVFSVLDRVGLINDAFNMAHVGRITYAEVLDLCKYLVKETDFFVWSSADSNLQFLLKRLYVHEAFDDLKGFILHLTKPLIDTVGWKDVGSFTQRRLRTLMLSLAVELDYQPAIDEARKWFAKWLADESIELNNNLRYTIYAIGVKYSTKEDWDEVYKRFHTTIVPSDKEDLMYALTRTRDARIIQILLDRTLDNTQIKSQSTVYVLKAIANNPSGLLYAWRFIQQHWYTLFDRYGHVSFTLSNLLKGVLKHFSAQFDLDQVTSFFADKDLGVAANSFQQAEEVIRDNMKWESAHLTLVSAWLKKFKEESLSDVSPR